MVGPATLPELVQVLDPTMGWVLVSGHAPLAAAEWVEALVPLTTADRLEPTRSRVARLSYDVLFETPDFFQVVEQLGRHGAHVRQFTKLPRADVDFNDTRTPVRVRRYQAFGLYLAIDLPHAHEVANVVALSSNVLDQALQRLVDE